MRIVVLLGGMLATCVGLSSTARATTAIRIDEATLVSQSTAVVTGTVERIHTSAHPTTQAIRTDIAIRVEEVVSGHAPTELLVLREIGGQLGERTEWVFGNPEYVVGEHVLVFVERTRQGHWRTASMAMGKYHLEDTTIGHRIARRSFGDGTTLYEPRTGQLIEQPGDEFEDLDPLLARIRARGAEGRAPGELVRTGGDEVPDEGDGGSATFTFLNPNAPARWFEPDDGIAVGYTIDSSGDSLLGLDAARSAIGTALAAWSDVTTSNLTLVDNGLAAPERYAGCNGSNRIVFNDPWGEVTDPVGCSGILAIGGYCRSTDTRTVNGADFYQIVVGKLMFNNGFQNCPGWNACAVAEVATHELGHTIGIGHATDADATMYGIAHFDGRCAGLRQDDRDAVAFIYPEPSGPTPTRTSTRTASATPTPTWTPLPTNTRTPTFTPSSTVTRTPTATRSSTRTPSATATVTNTPLPSNTPTDTPVPPPTATATASATRTATRTATSTRTPTATATITSSPLPTLTPTDTATPAPSATPSESPTRTATRTPTSTRTASLTATTTNSPLPSSTPTETNTPAPTTTPSESPTRSATRTPTSTRTASFTATTTSTPLPSATPTDTGTPVATLTPSETPTRTASRTTTSTRTASFTATTTNSPMPSTTPTETQTPVPTSTPSESPTRTLTRTATSTRSATPTMTSTSTPQASATRTETEIPDATATQTSTVTRSATRTATPTATQTATPPATATATDPPPATETRTPTETRTTTPSRTTTSTREPSDTPTDTETPTMTPTRSSTRTPSSTATGTATPSATLTRTSTATAPATATRTPTRTATHTRTETPPPSPTNTPPFTATRTATATRTDTPPPTDTRTATITRTPTVVPTATGTVVLTPRAPASLTPTATRTPSITRTRTATPTTEPTATATHSPTDTRTVAPTATSSATHTPIATQTPEATDTSTPTQSPTATATDTRQPTATATASAPTATPTGVFTARNPPPTATTTETVEPPAQISGRVTYYGTDSPIMDASIAVDAAQHDSTLSAADGRYRLESARAGAQTIALAKLGDQKEAIDASDAVRLLEVLSHAQTLDPIETAACDVDGNGRLDRRDAEQILDVVVGARPRFDAATLCDSDWLFFPNPDAGLHSRFDHTLGRQTCASRRPTIDTSTGDVEQNFSAVLLGNCSGAWSAEKATLITVNTADVMIGRPLRTRGSRMRVPLTVHGRFSAAEIELQFDPDRLEPIRIRARNRQRHLVVRYGSDRAGTLTIAIARSSTRVSDVPLELLLEFRSPRQERFAGTSPTVTELRLNSEAGRPAP